AVPIPPDVLDRDPALVATDAHRHGSPGRLELTQPAFGGWETAAPARRDLRSREVADPPEQVVEVLDAVGLAVLGERLEGQLEVGERLGIEKLAQLLLPERLAEQVAIERERAGPTLGQRCVALVHVCRDVVEQERRGEWRGLGRLDAMDRDLPALDAAKDLAQRVEIEDVRQALAVRLDQDRE